jgi:hypothetical protein
MSAHLFQLCLLGLLFLAGFERLSVQRLGRELRGLVEQRGYSSVRQDLEVEEGIFEARHGEGCGRVCL